MNNESIFAVVVTYNRKNLLKKNIIALTEQTRKLDAIIVVDNASSDGTVDMLETIKHPSILEFIVLSLPENIGGSGGFAKGIKHAIDKGADFVWVMDDDAFPEKDALQKLLKNVSDDINLYGCISIADHQTLSWRLSRTSTTQRSKLIQNVGEVPEVACVEFLPFLGLLISKRLVERIGLPDEGFFLAADDVDYCFRARKIGANVVVVGSSRLHHPAAESYPLRLPWRLLWCLKLPPWKRYYDVRNRLFVARKHYGLALYYKTIPGSILRLAGTLVYEDQRMAQIKAFWAGMIDGLMKKKGRRHELWGL